MRVVWLVSFPKHQTIKFVLSIFQKWDICCKSKCMYNAHKFVHTVTVVVSVNFVSIGCWHWTCNILNNPQYIANGSIKPLGYCFRGCFIMQNHVYNRTLQIVHFVSLRFFMTELWEPLLECPSGQVRKKRMVNVSAWHFLSIRLMELSHHDILY